MNKTLAPIQISIAMQGGGALGAYTWGVLDRVLQEPALNVRAVSGASAGAMNAVIMASHLHKGIAAVQEALAGYWKEVSMFGLSAMSNMYTTPPATGNPFADALLNSNPWVLFAQQWMHGQNRLMAGIKGASVRMMSPYELNPAGINLLRPLVEKYADFSAIHRGSMEVLVSATEVETGRARIFRKHELNIDIVLASACLPTLFQAVKIKGRHYWDGGFSSNPSLIELFENQLAEDCLLIPLLPIQDGDIPRSNMEIAARMSNIAFNQPLLAELRAMALLREATPPDSVWSKTRLHVIFDKSLNNLNADAQLNTDWRTLQQLHVQGIQAAEHFLKNHGDKLGRESSVSIDDYL